MIRAIEAASGAELTRQVAEDYRSKGYEVTLQPGPDQLPPSLAELSAGYCGAQRR